jgi:hypothetical protein
MAIRLVAQVAEMMPPPQPRWTDLSPCETKQRWLRSLWVRGSERIYAVRQKAGRVQLRAKIARSVLVT